MKIVLVVINFLQFFAETPFILHNVYQSNTVCTTVVVGTCTEFEMNLYSYGICIGKLHRYIKVDRIYKVG